MSRKMNNNWPAKKNDINFNQKQWRQDLASFVHDQLFWPATRVSKSKIISGGRGKSAIREFYVYNSNGIEITVKYKNYNEIVSTSDADVITKYFKNRRVI